MNFIAQLQAATLRNRSLVCVGLDPEPQRFPPGLRARHDAIFEFCSAIVDATAEFVCCFKPQFAHFAAHRAEDALERLIAHVHARHPGVPVILDAKRGDIGSTAQQYAIEAFDRYAADAVTLNPYLGRDAVQPFLDRAEKGAVLLCHTSNAGAADLQDLVVRTDRGEMPLYQHVAATIAQDWNANGNCAVVVGATFPAQLAEVRRLIGDMPILVPGVGAQSGDVDAVVRNGATASGNGLMISSSRAILYASAGENFALAAAAATRDLRDAINRARLR